MSKDEHKIGDEHWHDAQHDEKDWWGNCVNTTWEELKQTIYARYMGIDMTWNEHGPYYIDLNGKAVLDIGGGPVSMLLKAEQAPNCTVVDPCDYPTWVIARYQAAGIEYAPLKGEAVNTLMTSKRPKYDEVWIYNVLQHTDDPALIIEHAKNALKPNGTFRIFEWIDAETNTAHPHMLTEELLNKWIGQKGDIVQLNEMGCVGKAYFGHFTIKP